MPFYTYIIIMFFISFQIYSQDTIKSIEYFKLKEKVNGYVITDDFKSVYKQYNKKKNNEFVLIENSFQKLSKLFFIDKTAESTDKQITINDDLLMAYYQKNIVAPKHGGDPNQATVSFIIRNSGELIKIVILDDVKNRCDSSLWGIKIVNDIKFKPIKGLSKDALIEYVLKLDAICYYECNTTDNEIITPITK